MSTQAEGAHDAGLSQTDRREHPCRVEDHPALGTVAGELQKEKEQKWSKVPYSVHTLQLAKSQRSRDLGRFDKVYGRYLNNGFDGIGFVLSADDGFSGVDLDKCEILKPAKSNCGRARSSRGLTAIRR